MRARRWMVAATFVAVAATLITCWGAEQPPSNESSRLEVIAAVPADADAAGVRMELVGCEDTRPIVSRTLSFDEGVARHIANRPIRLAKAHLLAGQLWSVPPGCYRMRAVPVDLDAARLEGCTAARTPPMPVGPDSSRHLLLLARCGDAPFDTSTIDAELNFGPHITELSQRRLPGHPTGAVEVCARARDPESDALSIDWSARDGSGGPVWLGATHRRGQFGDTLDECIRLSSTKSTHQQDDIDVTATVFDGERSPARGFVSYEALRLHRHGIAAPSRAQETLRLAAEPAQACPDGERAYISGWTYWIYRDGTLLAPTDDLDAVEPGDHLDVEVKIDGCGHLPVEVTSSRRAVADSAATVHDRDGGTFQSGAHILSLKVPDKVFSILLEAGLPDRKLLDATSPGS